MSNGFLACLKTIGCVGFYFCLLVCLLLISANKATTTSIIPTITPPMCLHLAVVGELACPIDPMCLPMDENYISDGSWDRDQTKRDTTCCSAATAVSSKCRDGPLCSFQAAVGECEAEPENMLIVCPRACRNPCLCDVSAFTNDTACDCIIRAKNVSYCNTSQASIDCQTTCTKVTHESCPPLNLPTDPNARLSTWSTHYLVTVTEVCIPGYLPRVDRNQGMKLCSAQGNWVPDYINGNPVECTVVDCGSPPTTVNTICVATETTFGSTVDYVCAQGCVPESGQRSLVCNASALWEGQPLTCRRVECGFPPSSPNATITVTNTTLRGIATYTCVPGYMAAGGDTSLYCNMSGVWQGSPLTCTAVDCSSPPFSPNTEIQISGTSFNQSANYSCLPGFEYEQGQFLLICGPSGNWTGDALTCKIIDCGVPPSDIGLSIDVTNTTYGQVANYSCRSGYTYSSGDFTLTCDLGGNWAGELMKCLVIDCGVPPSDIGLSIDVTNTTYGQVANYSCRSGYTYSSGDFTLTCDLGGNWAGELMKCLVIDCGVPPSDIGLSIDVTNTTYGQVANYSCRSGYTYSSGDFTLTCDLGGNWAGELMKCLASQTTSYPERSDHSTDVLVPWVVGVTIFIVFILVIIIFVIMNKEAFSRNKKLRKTVKTLRDNAKSIFNFHVRIPDIHKINTKTGDRLSSCVHTAKPGGSPAQSLVSIQVKDGGNFHLVDKSRTVKARDSGNFLLAATPSNVKPSFPPAFTNYLAPTSSLVKHPSTHSMPRSPTSITIHSLSQTSTPEVLPAVNP